MSAGARSSEASDPVEPLLQRIVRVATSAGDEEDQRDDQAVLSRLLVPSAKLGLIRLDSIAKLERGRPDQDLPTANQGWIEVIVGSMFSGKSEELIRRLRRAQIARQKVQIFKPLVDTRYAEDHIVSHSEMRIPSDNLSSSRDLLARDRSFVYRSFQVYTRTEAP